MIDSTLSKNRLPRLKQPCEQGLRRIEAQEPEWIFVPATVAASYWTWVILSHAVEKGL